MAQARDVELRARTGGLAEGLTAEDRSTSDRAGQMVGTSAMKHFGVRLIRQLRMRRAGIFGSTLFGEPAWDILLELYAAHLEHRTRSISSVWNAAGVPQSTALRWIKHLEIEEWICRSSDDSNGISLRLTSRGQVAMESLFDMCDWPLESRADTSSAN